MFEASRYTRVCSVGSIAFLAAVLQAGALTTTVFNNTSGDGLRGTAANWSLGTVPSSTNVTFTGFAVREPVVVRSLRHCKGKS